MAPCKKISKKTKFTTAKPRAPPKSSKAAAKPKPKPNATRPKKAVEGRKKIWAGEVFVLLGDLHPQYNHRDIERWILYHGGRVHKEVTSETTHLICTMEEFKNKVTHVKEALKLGQARCKIVSYSYIEDCLLDTKKPKRLLEKSYLLSQEIAKKRKERNGAELTAEGFIKDIERSKELIDPKLYRIYCDPTFFEHKVVLTRSNIDYGGKTYQEKYTIFLFESRAWPHLYSLGMKYQKGSRPMVLERDQHGDKLFLVAFNQFKKIFKRKTGIDWDKRLDKLPTPEDHYVYTPPTGGKPVGALPEGWMPPPFLKSEQHADGTADNNEPPNGENGVIYDPDLRDDTDGKVDDMTEATILGQAPKVSELKEQLNDVPIANETAHGEDVVGGDPGRRKGKDSEAENS